MIENKNNIYIYIMLDRLAQTWEFWNVKSSFMR